ncbi:methyltransferase, putative [Plasmodium berghei]|uniref:Methyltransferase, putative n=2 Tax=Plasmodium berghei TaxID=5821 RepID=A0A509AI76_PLABA|nr:methyltransferase, putative [Plasmodium berghei ANKA]CXI28962.1 methyltransferase, putative [Plasmodium berghei]SCM20651.1 methyltransferase, putative [Plasmodium berghei]VUC55176.1 methyltransferase, putative [Plasmodium berghei ANKA]|eukprot:XP_034420989.1 methyltransferase, putative [Plasmodium berghei ANKA]
MEEERRNDVTYYNSNNILEKNDKFFNYYIGQNIINENEIDEFMEIINKELPITFRVLKNNKFNNFIHENIKKKLEGICKNNYSITQLNEDDHIYEIYLTRSQIKKDENYKNLYSYLINLNESGYIFRQELVSMLPVLFLKLQENFFVLDMCAAPGSKTAQIVDYMHLIANKKYKNYLINKFIQNNHSKLYKHIGKGDGESGEGSEISENKSSENDENNIVTMLNESTDTFHSAMENQKKEIDVKDPVNEENESKYNKDNEEDIYKTYYNILENNLYDDEFFKYILNADHNLYNEYKKLISNNNPTGVVVANDANFKRCCMLFHRLKNIHSNCLIVTNNNAVIFPYLYLKNKLDNSFEKIYFDSVLCDVPCSGDGTLRKDRNIWINWNPLNAYNLFQLQVNILKRSIELVKEGGYVIYSTCSLNPIENEAVICEVFNLLNNGESLKLINFENELVKKLNYREGLTEWKLLIDDKWFNTYDEFIDYLKSIQPEKFKKIYEKIKNGMFTPNKEFMEKINLKYVKRFFPHHYNAGGFFIALIEKCGQVQWKERSKHDVIKNIIKAKGADLNELEKEAIIHRYKNKKYKKKKNKKKKKNEKINNIHHPNEISEAVEKEHNDIIPHDKHIQTEKQMTGNDEITKSYNMVGSDEFMNDYNMVNHFDIIKNNKNGEMDEITDSYNVVGSSNILRASILTQNPSSSGYDIIELINKKSEEKLNNYIGNNVANENVNEKDFEEMEKNEEEQKEESEEEEWEEVGKMENMKNVEEEKDIIVNIDKERYTNYEYKDEFNLCVGSERLKKQQEYIPLNYYESLLKSNDLLNKIKTYFNLNDDFLSIKDNLYIHLKDDNNSSKLGINDRINSNIKKINFVSNNTKNVLESYTKIKLKIISAGITVIQVDKNKKNNVENYYRINYSGCINFMNFFKNIDDFLLNTKYRQDIIKNFFSTVYENKERVFDFDSYMNKLIGERKSVMQKSSSNKNGKETKDELDENVLCKKETENVAPISKDDKNETSHNNIGQENNFTTDMENNSTLGDTNIIWVKSDVILDLIKVDKSKINSITNETIKQTEQLNKYSPNVLLTLNKNKQILAIPSNKGNIYVDITIDKNSIMMLPYILN